MERKFKIGDKVIYVGCNKEYHGKILEIERIDNSLEYCYKVKGEVPFYWVQEKSLIPLNKKHIDRIIFRDNATILIKDGKKYVAKCCEGDTYDKEKGLLVCLAKASGYTFNDLQEMLQGAEYQGEVKHDKPSNAVREVKRQAKVGEYIKIIENSKDYERIGYKTGDILKVYKITEDYGVYCELKEKVKDCFIVEDNGNIIICNEEYVVLENYKPYKITLSEFLSGKNNVAVHTKNEEQFSKLHKLGKKQGVFKYVTNNDWEYYKNETCLGFLFKEGGYARKQFYEKEGLTVYNFDEVDLNN